MQAQAHIFFNSENSLRSLKVPIVISLLCHLVLFALVLYSPGRLSSHRTSMKVVNVNLVSLSQIAGTTQSKGTAAGKGATHQLSQKVPSPQTAPTARQVPATPKSAKVMAPDTSKWSEKTSLKKETFKPEQSVKKAVRKIEQAEESRPSSVARAIDRIRSEIGQRSGESFGIATDSADSSVEGSSGGLAGVGPAGGVVASEILIYQQEIAYHIRNNWVYPEQLIGQRKDMETRLKIRIAADGEIKDIQFDKKSGNSYLDESAYKAILKSSPLPALPKGYQFYTVLLGFTPAGLQ